MATTPTWRVCKNDCGVILHRTANNELIIQLSFLRFPCKYASSAFLLSSSLRIKKKNSFGRLSLFLSSSSSLLPQSLLVFFLCMSRVQTMQLGYQSLILLIY